MSRLNKTTACELEAKLNYKSGYLEFGITTWIGVTEVWTETIERRKTSKITCFYTLRHFSSKKIIAGAGS